MKKSIFVVFGIVLLLFGICNPCFAEFQKGPYLQYVVNASDGQVETDRIKILWETDLVTTGEVRYKESTVAVYEEPVTGWPTDGIADQFHEVLVTGLAPGTKYDYKVWAGTESDEFTFTTLTSEDDHSFSFVVYGDNQKHSFYSTGPGCSGIADPADHAAHVAVVDLIKSMSPSPQFVVNIGDLYYANQSSLGGCEGEYVQGFFEIEHGLINNTPLFPTRGNHEQVETGDDEDRFEKYFAIPANLTSNEADAYYSFNYGNSHFLVINTEIDCSGPIDCTISGDQLTAITTDLNEASSNPGIRHIFVFMHRAAHSNGAPAHGSAENPLLSQTLGPLFRANNVDIVFQGHDHFYERFKPDTTSSYPFDPPDIHLIEEGVTYVVTGGGGAILRDVPAAGTIETGAGVEHPLESAVSEKTFEAMHVQVSGGEVYVRVMTVDEATHGNLDGDGTVEPSYLLDHFFVSPTTVTNGLEWLRGNQNSDGSWYDNPAITGLGALAFLNAGYTADDPYDAVVGDAIDYITGFIQSDGSITGGVYPNYETSICILPLVATYNSTYNTIIGDAKDYLLGIQNTETNGYSPDDEVYGGWGYPSSGWADLSNTQWTLMGLHFAYDALGLSDEGEAWVNKALTWVRHCQNDETINDFPFAAGRTDGGLTYNPAGIGPQTTNESYASMTYAGIWSYALLGLDEISDEIGAAIGWVESNYSINSNPPYGDFAMYYNYVTMAKALAMIDVSEVDGNSWQEDLTEQLETIQHEDGYWVNSNTEEWEGVPELCTAYAILALQAFQNPPTNLWMEVILESPADLVVYDPQGRLCGKDGCNIPGATFDVTGHQTVTLPALESGHYRFEIIGTGNGIVHLTVNGYRGDEQISTVCKEFEIKIYEVWEADVMLSSLVGPLTIDMVQEPEFMHATVNDGCDGGGGKDIDTLTAYYDANANEIVVEMVLCKSPDNNKRTKYRVHFDHTAPFAYEEDRNGDGVVDECDFCVTTSDDTMMHRVNKDNGPGDISVNGNKITFTVPVNDLNPDLNSDDTVYIWAVAHYKNVKDRAPDTDGGDGCSKPEVVTETIQLNLRP